MEESWRRRWGGGGGGGGGAGGRGGGGGGGGGKKKTWGEERVRRSKEGDKKKKGVSRLRERKREREGREEVGEHKTNKGTKRGASARDGKRGALLQCRANEEKHRGSEWKKRRGNKNHKGTKKEAADGRIRSCMYLVSLHLRLLSQPDSSSSRAVGEQIAQGILDEKQ